MTMTYSATVTHEDGAWLAECDQEPTAHTWGRTLTHLRSDIADAIILAADLPDDTEIQVRLKAGPGVPTDVAWALELGNRRAELRAEEARLRQETLASVTRLVDEGYSVRDVAGAVGLTPGRITQMAS